MRIGVPCEKPTQPLVAATPDTVGKLRKLGYVVSVEAGAGIKASYPDQQYLDAGATLVDHAEAWTADIVLCLDEPTDEETALLRRGATLITRLAPARNEELLEKLRGADVTALAMDVVPRISRAQAMDVLSSQANVAGYRAVIEAAHDFGRLFTGQVTAAGKMPPARVYVIGAGVAGLAAIGTASSMGAEVFASDVRPEVAEQVESMGARFVGLQREEVEASADGYARALTEEETLAVNRLYAEQAALADIVITTANIPGRESPILLDDEAIAGMKPGSVIIDMAAANGGNTTQTVAGEKVLTGGGVTISGPTDLAALLPTQSSQLYSQNIVNLLRLMTPEKDGVLDLNLEDDIVRGITVTNGGKVLWPPPPIKVSAVPAAPAAPVGPSPEQLEAERKRKRNLQVGWSALAAVLLVALVMVTPAVAGAHYIVLALAIIVGFYVITNVSHSLHTPLMSVTNAISGIILVGAILQVGSDNLLVSILSFVAIVVASINIFGGFTVTARMLTMFQKA